jgi:RHS repeat-associated protein
MPAGVAEWDNGSVIYKSNDHLGSPRIITNASGSVIGRTDLYPYGEVWSETGTTTKYKLTGKERDSESGNDDFGARAYWNGVGRWLSVDQHSGDRKNPQSRNRYSYVANDPINAIDPDGRESKWVVCSYYDKESGWVDYICGATVDWGGGGGGGDPTDIDPGRRGEWGYNRTEVGDEVKRMLGTEDCGNFVLKVFDMAGHKLDRDKSAADINSQSWGWLAGISTNLGIAQGQSGLGTGDTTLYSRPNQTNPQSTSAWASAGRFGNYIDLWRPFFWGGSLGQAQTLIHEEIHILTTLVDSDLALLLGWSPSAAALSGSTRQYEDEASRFWGGKLREKCK